MKNVNDIRRIVAEKNPLVHCITNPISINQCANAVLSVGARPMMAEHPKEVGEITATADALMLNMGNITDARMESILISAKCGREREIPVVLDVVGIACSSLRREYISNLLKEAVPTVIKGNYSEIKALYDEEYCSAGVDADVSIDAETMSEIAVTLSQRYGSIILATGKKDIIADGKRLACVNNGTAQLSAVTGTGCMLGALCAAFMTSGERMDAVISACAVFGICGELSKTEKGNGTFMVNLMDKLSEVEDDEIDNYLNVRDTLLA